jgi:hypothetical protein
MDNHQKRQFQFSGIYLLLAFAGLLIVQEIIERQTAPRPVPMSTLMDDVRAGKVSKVLIRDTDVLAELKPEGDKAGETPERIVATRLPGIDETDLVEELRKPHPADIVAGDLPGGLGPTHRPDRRHLVLPHATDAARWPSERGTKQGPDLR